MRFRIGLVVAATASMGLSMAMIALPASGTSVVETPTTAGGREEMTIPDVQLVLRFDEIDMALDETVTIEAALFNDSNQPIFVYRKLAFGPLGGVVLHIQDMDGRTVESPLLLDALPGAPRPGDRHVFIRLEPGHFLGTSVTCKVRDLLPTSGRFSVSAAYLCPLLRELYGSTQPDPRTVWRETGVIRSRAITVDVR